MAPRAQKANTGKKMVKAAKPVSTASTTVPRSKVTKKTSKGGATTGTAQTTATKAKGVKADAKSSTKMTTAQAKPAKKSTSTINKEDSPVQPISKKRGRTDESTTVDVTVDRPVKKVKSGPFKVGPPKIEPAINTPPTEKLNVYVFGTGESGELGLGATIRDGKKPKDVKRPRLNDLLSAETVGVVQVAVGGMHCVALTQDQKILTWGVNDNGALGRDTTWEAPTHSIDAGSDTDSEDGDVNLNPKESTPTAIPADYFGEEPRKFVQVAATDSASFALTEDGHVYGWGTFRGADGTIGFTTEGTTEAARTKKDELKYQRKPLLLAELKKIVQLAAGGNHVLALDNKGNVFAWGCGEQRQLGRRVIERNRALVLTPTLLGLPKKHKIVSLAAGAYHSFAIDSTNQVLTWGLNNFGQTGISAGAGEGAAIIEKATVIDSLKGMKVTEVAGGLHHSLACTEDGKLLVWGRCDDSQAGIPLDTVPKDNLVFDSREKPRILSVPAVIPNIAAKSVAAGIDNSLAITTDGRVYSWGFSSNYRTGLGTEDSISEATVIENTALKGKKITFAGCGGQFSVVAGPASA